MDILKNLSEVTIILASGSPRRKELLGSLGLKYNVKVSNIEEKPMGNTPKEIVESLSKQKTEAVVSDILRGNQIKNPCIVIGADTAVFLDNTMLGKPENQEEAYKMIGAIQGKKHDVYTGVTLGIIKNNTVRYDTFYEKTVVKVTPMTNYEIDCYIKLGESLDKAGAYGIQGDFSIFVEGIEGDHNNVIGLPVAALYTHLKDIDLFS